MFITIILLEGRKSNPVFPILFAILAGIHPETCLDPVNNFENFTEEFHKYYDQQLAVGETGLDFLAIQDHAQRDRTAAIFRQVLGFAVEIQEIRRNSLSKCRKNKHYRFWKNFQISPEYYCIVLVGLKNSFSGGYKMAGISQFPHQLHSKKSIKI